MAKHHRNSLLSLILFVGALVVRGQTPSFGVAATFPAGVSPTAVAAGDFNGDGKPDVAVTNQTSMLVFLNNGSGGFQPPAAYNFTAGTNPQHVAAGDLNNDGKLDLVVVNQGTGTVSVFMGNGDGTFSGPTGYQAGTNPRWVVISDVNGDNKADLIVVDSGTATGSGVSVLLGTGTGSFGAASFFAAGSVSLSVAVGDFNGDGKKDLAVANSGSDNYSILLGNGDGTFQTAVNHSLDLPGISVSPTSIVTADFNFDGKLDLALATPNVKNVAVLLGNGDGTFQTAVHNGLDDPNFVNNRNTLAVADMNQDGIPDLVIDNLSSDHITILFGTFSGTFPTAVSYAAGPEPTGIAIADFDGNGSPDIVAADSAVDGEIALLLNRVIGELQAARLFRSSFIPLALAVGDLNGDGKPDIVTATTLTPVPSGIGSGAVMLGNGDGTFQPPQIWSTSAVVSAVALGDFNGDGKLDLVAINPTPGNGTASVYLGNGDGTFQTPVTYAVGVRPQAVAVADLNGDGKLDLIITNRSSANVSILLGIGNGTFQTAVNYNTPTTGTPDSVAVADFNNDGKLDLAVANSGVNASSVSIFFGNGDGTFQPQVELPSGFHSSGTLSLAALDLNSDGNSDFAVTDGTTLAVVLGNGNGSFRFPVTYTLVGPGAAVVGSLLIGDFNSDGKADIVATTRDGISMLIGNGDGSFQDAVNYSPFIGGAIAAGDFDGDGRLDLVTADASQDSVSTDTVAILMNQTMIPVSITINVTPNGPDVYFTRPIGAGVIESSPCTGQCVYQVNFDDPIELTANDVAITTQELYRFVFWSNGGPADQKFLAPRTAATYTAYFRLSYNLTTGVSPGAGGTVTVPQGYDFYPGLANYFDSGSVVSITATPNSGYKFVGWTGSVADPNNPSTTVTMNGPETVTANFAPLITVPNVVGQTQSAATSAITGAGLVVGTVTTSSSDTVVSGSVISESPSAGTPVAGGSAVNLVISSGPSTVTAPQVVAFNVLFGSSTYNILTSSRIRLPWQITGIQVVFSEPIASGGTASISGATATNLQGLGTNTLTWTINPIAIGNILIVLSGSGSSALKDAAGTALAGGTGFSQMLKILWGDFNDDGAVSASDLVSVNQALTKPYNIFADMNGDGVVNAGDVQIVRTRAGTSLP